MAHWSSHGYLAKGGKDGPATAPHGNGFVVLKRQGDGMVTVRSPANSSQQPSSLPSTVEAAGPGENNYFSVRGMRDMINKAGDQPEEGAQSSTQKYFSVDAKFLHQNLDMKNKLRENLRAAQVQQRQSQDLSKTGSQPFVMGVTTNPLPPLLLSPLTRDHPLLPTYDQPQTRRPNRQSIHRQQTT